MTARRAQALSRWERQVDATELQPPRHSRACLHAMYNWTAPHCAGSRAVTGTHCTARRAETGVIGLN